MATVPLEEAAMEVGEAAGKEIVDFTVGLVSVTEGNAETDPEADLAGSGTLVDLNGTCGILTAWHVLRHLANKTVGLVIVTRFERQLHRFVLEREDVHLLKIASGTAEAEGPDLGLLVLSPPAVVSLKAWKSFYNVSRRRESILSNPPRLEDGLWCLSVWLRSRTYRGSGPGTRIRQGDGVPRGLCGRDGGTRILLRGFRLPRL